LKILIRIGAEGDIDFRDISETSAAGMGCVALPSTLSTVETHALSTSASTPIPTILIACSILLDPVLSVAQLPARWPSFLSFDLS
jgi:hypothetical protein